MAVLTTSIPGGKLVSRGKVRDIYAVDQGLLLIATDRISAFDCVLSPGIPGRGVILPALELLVRPVRRRTEPPPRHRARALPEALL
jgi:hypothetical protein